ncbi:hypothetical protein EDD18DRAFT_1144287 [Armillaria luteobubalina]|uniref:Uncharacterized protein n=1 Tax=Armillaria luteobubalina TaxID=153913 RepID=A0AA39QF45_9AGAR|nr:hypothetical protein EDD18DRAFT_1144287 [Armillaria luteobubalina]
MIGSGLESIALVCFFVHFPSTTETEPRWLKRVDLVVALQYSFLFPVCRISFQKDWLVSVPFRAVFNFFRA